MIKDEKKINDDGSKLLTDNKIPQKEEEKESSKVLIFSQSDNNQKESYYNNSNSTTDVSQSNYSTLLNNFGSFSNYERVENEKQFNKIRSKFYLKNSLYDNLLSQIFDPNIYPEKYKINDNYWAFLYNNDLKTYPITISGFIFKKDKHIVSDDIQDNDSKWYENLGLFFCGEEVKFGNENLNKRCLPSQCFCEKCLFRNVKKYNLGKYLININGRVAKINKEKYHCFGHFLCGNQIEDCITNFTCKACLMLNFQKNIK